jgi:3'-phosphoadenosine 5'-phosphosulfate sulfotransferase (PAPS reductase)/FAD synthetase
MIPSREHPVRTKGYEAAWEEAARLVASRRISGLQVPCPRCGSKGMLFSKWVNGQPVKPLYVIHGNGTGRLKSCPLDVAQAARARLGTKLTRDDVAKLLRLGKAYALFSGGKDSLCLIEYMRRMAKRAGVEITALHADTTAGFPEVESYVRRVCRKLDVKLEVVRPLCDYFELAKRWGIPGVKSRWCCETLKIAPMRRFLQGVEGPKVVFDGIRAAESRLRATYVPVWYHPSFRCISVSPIFGWSNEKVARFIDDSRLPLSPVAETGTSGECWCGAYKGRADFEALLKIRPEIFNKLVTVEKAQKGRYTFIYEDGERVPLTTLAGAERSSAV